MLVTLFLKLVNRNFSHISISVCEGQKYILFPYSNRMKIFLCLRKLLMKGCSSWLNQKLTRLAACYTAALLKSKPNSVE